MVTGNQIQIEYMATCNIFKGNVHFVVMGQETENYHDIVAVFDKN